MSLCFAKQFSVNFKALQKEGPAKDSGNWLLPKRHPTIGFLYFYYEL